MPNVPPLCHPTGGKTPKRQIDLRIAELAAAQRGLVTAAQLIDIGVSRRTIESRVRRALLHQVHRGVYAVGHSALAREARWLAAVLVCGPEAALSHRSAAALWGIRGTSATNVDVTSPTGRGRRRRGIHVYEAHLTPADLTDLHGIPCTTLPRTIIDLATVISPTALEYAIHRAEAQRKLTPADLRDALARLGGKKGTAAVRAIVGTPDHDLDARTRGPWERRFLAVCRAHAIPEPRVNEWIALDIAAGGLEVDFSWPGRWLVVEVDEEASHGTLRARRNDPERDRALRDAGWRVVRVAEADFRDPARVASTVHRALQAGGESSS